jgi:hypothetical protein
VSFLRGLLAGRSHLAFLVGLGAAFATVKAIGGVGETAAPWDVFAASAPDARKLPLRGRGPLTPGEERLARAAWRYVERNTDPTTGLTASVKGHPATTMWDLGSQLLAVLAAEDLGLVTRAEASRRLGRAVASLAAMPLAEGRLPNKSYDTRTLAMVDYDGSPAPAGVGWSALDVARVLVPLRLVTVRHPELTARVRQAVSRFSLESLTDGAELRGATRRPGGALETHQEGRLGYEQYAARALLAWGVVAPVSLDHRAHLAFAVVGGETVPQDARSPREHGGAHAAVLSEPWILGAIEGGFDAVTLPIARAVLRAQERRFEATGKVTAVSEDALDRAPWFVYSAIVNGEETWTAVASDGRSDPAHLTFSTKAAVAWGVLFDGSYPDRLLEAAHALVSEGEGLWAGRHDATGEVNRVLSLNTNAVVLEALAYRVRGPPLRRMAESARADAEGGRP